MPDAPLLFPAYRDDAAGNLYPFGDACSLEARTGLVLDRDLFEDAALYPVGVAGRCGITAIAVDDAGVTIAVGDDAGPACAVTFDPFGAPPSSLVLVDPAGRVAGILVVDPARLAAAQAWPAGVHAFPPGAAEFVASCVIPMPAAGLLGLAGGDAPPLAGDVWLVGEDGVVVRHLGGGVIRVDIVGDPLFLRRTCGPDDLFATPGFVRTVTVVDARGVPTTLVPDAYGNLAITAGANEADDTILRVAPTADGITFAAVGKDATD